ncbi:co-chaperone GroES, partial [bacterium]|nr:co-chaperone GroES [bacterium]
HPKHAIPVDLEANNVLFVVPIEDVVAVFRRDKKNEHLGKDTEEGLSDLDDFDETDEL